MNKICAIILVQFITLLAFYSCSEPLCEFEKVITFIENSERSSFEKCITSGTNVNSTSNKGESLLYHAIKNEEYELVNILVDNGVDVFSYATGEIPILQYSNQIGDKEISDLIISTQINYFEKAPDSTYNQIFQHAIEQDNPELVDRMIAESTVKVSEKLPNALLPVPWAAFSNSVESTRVLLENGANPDEEFDTRSALIIAAMYGNTEIAVLLLDHGADIDNYEGTHMTALMVATTNNHPEIVDLLLQNQADTTIVDLNGNTAMNYAKTGSNKDVKVLFGLE